MKKQIALFLFGTIFFSQYAFSQQLSWPLTVPSVPDETHENNNDVVTSAFGPRILDSFGTNFDIRYGLSLNKPKDSGETLSIPGLARHRPVMTWNEPRRTDQEARESLLKCIKQQTTIQSDQTRKISADASELWKQFFGQIPGQK